MRYSAKNTIFLVRTRVVTFHLRNRKTYVFHAVNIFARYSVILTKSFKSYNPSKVCIELNGIENFPHVFKLSWIRYEYVGIASEEKSGKGNSAR